MTPWTETHQAPLSRGFPRQEYWSRLSFTSPGNLPNPGSKPASLCPVSPALAGRFFPTEPPGKPIISNLEILKSVWEDELKLYAKSTRFYISNKSIGGFWYPEGRNVLETKDNFTR